MENNLCFNCVNYSGDLTCLAFKQIPEEILLGENDHSKPLKGQANDVIFQQRKQGEKRRNFIDLTPIK